MEFLESVQSKFQKYHKKNNLIEHCKTRTEKFKMTQKELRIQKIDEGRPLENVFTPAVRRIRRSPQKKSSSPHVDRLTRLKMWKVEREKKLVEKKSSQKPLFKVGAAKNIGFPALKGEVKSFAPQNHEFKAPKNIKPINIKNKIKDKTIQRVTRSQKPVASPPLPLPVAARRKRKTKQDQTNTQINDNKENNFVSHPEVQNQITTKKKLQRQNAIDGTPGRRKSLRKNILAEENNINEDITNKKTPSKTPMKSQPSSLSIANNLSPENKASYVSPYVTTSRGKGSVKKENLNRSVLGLPSFSESSSLDSSATYFYTVLNNEISRLQDFCDIWTEYKDSSEDLSEDAKDLIDVAVGQATLLMNKKFKQFEGLIKACQTGEGADKEVTCEDLQGFWDMIYMQVENLNARFNRLTTLKDNNWKEIETTTTAKPKVVKKRAPPAKTKTTKPSAASSGIRAAILAARKKKKGPQHSSPQPSSSKLSTPEKTREESVFNGGFFEVRTPIKTPKPTPKSILKGNKKTSVAIMNKSVLFKDEDTESEPERDLNTTFEKTEKTPSRREKTPRKCRTPK